MRHGTLANAQRGRRRVPTLRHVFVLALATLALPLAGCGPSHCADFPDSSSDRLQTGETAQVVVDVNENGLIEPLDVNGGIYEVGSETGETLAAGPRRQDASVRRTGSSLTLIVEGQEFALSGPVACQ
jgi:hypothetical protein